MGMLAACLLLSIDASATDDRMQVHGFFSQAAVHTNDNNVGGNSDGGWGLDVREMGVNVSYRSNADWLFSGQALARWAGSSDEGDPRVDYAFVDHTLSSDEHGRMGVQIGKVKNSYGLYNTTRDVAHTRPGILMPQSVYLDRVRNFFLAAPGVSLYGNHSHDAWDVNWRFNVIRPASNSPDLESLLLLADRPGRFRGKGSWLAQVITEKDGGRLRMGLTLGDVATEYDPGAADPLTNGSSTLKPRLLSLEWNEERWSLTGEYALVQNIAKNYGTSPLAMALQQPNTVEAWYLQATYRPTPEWQIFLRRDEIYLDRDDKNGQAFSSITGLPGYITYAKDWTLGVRKDFGNWAVSAEWHDVDGTVWLSPLDTPLPSQQKDWRMLLLQAAYRF